MIETIIGAITTFIINSIYSLGYLGIAAMMTLESANILLPSEVILPFGGFLAAQGRFTLVGVTLAGAVGCLIGSMLSYVIGYWGGRAFILKYGKYVLISHKDLDKAEYFFNKYGSGAIFFSRLLPVVRTFISLPAGIAEMNFPKFIIYTFIGSVPWCLALAYIGKKLGDNWDSLGAYFHRFDFIIVLAIIALAVWYVWRHLKNIKNQK